MAIIESFLSGLKTGTIIGFFGSIIFCAFWLRSITKEVREDLARARDAAYRDAREAIAKGEWDGTGG